MSHKKSNINYDYFNADDVEQEVISSKPTSFLLLGKPHSGRKRLSKLLAKSWNCVHVDVTDLCEELAEQKLLPKDVLNNLNDGKIISDREMLQEVSKKLRSNIVNHRGYVLTGVPSVEHNNAAMYQSQIELLLNIFPQPDFIIYLKMDNEDIIELVTNRKLDPLTQTTYTVEEYDPHLLEQKPETEKKKKRMSSRVSGSLTSSILGYSDIFEGDEEDKQDDTISDITMTTLVTMRRALEQAHKTKTQLPIDILDRLIIPQEFLPAKSRTMLDFYTSTIEPIFYNEYIAKSNVQRLFELNALKTSQSLLTEILDRLRCFHCKPTYVPAPFYVNLEELEEEERRERKAHNSPENKIRKWGVIKSSMFEESLQTLSQELLDFDAEKEEEEESEGEAFPIIPPSEGSVEDMISENESKDVGEEDMKKMMTEEVTIDAEMPVNESNLTEEEFYLKLAHMSKVDRKWKWKKSRWFHYCPVALTKGLVIPGRLEYSVSYLDKIYALSSLEALKSFVENPRLFLRPPWPKNHCKVVIIGYPHSGKTTVSEALARVYGAKIIDMEKIMEPALEIIRSAYRQATVRSVIRSFLEKIAEKTLKQRRKKSADAFALTPEHTEMFTSLFNGNDKMHFHSQHLFDSRRTQDYRTTTTMDSDFKTEEFEKEEDEEENILWTEEEEDEGEIESIRMQREAEEEEETEEELQAHSEVLALEESKISMADEEESDLEQTLVSGDDPDVVEVVEEIMRDYVPEIPPNELISLTEEAILNAQKELSCERKEEVQDGRWVLDNFPLDLKYWEALMNSKSITRPTTVFFLNDESQIKEIILSRWYSNNRREINEQIIKRIDGIITQELRDERKEELGNLMEDLQAGEMAVDSPKVMQESDQKEVTSELEADADGKRLIVSQHQSTKSDQYLDTEGGGKRLSQASGQLPMTIDQPKPDEVEMQKADYYNEEFIHIEGFDDEDNDDDSFPFLEDSKRAEILEERMGKETLNASNFRREEEATSETLEDNANLNSTTLEDNADKNTVTPEGIYSRGVISPRLDISSVRSSMMKSKLRESKRTLMSGRRDKSKLKKENVLKSLGLPRDINNEIFLKNLNKFAVLKGELSQEFGPEEGVPAHYRISKGNIMDNLSLSEVLSTERLSETSNEFVQVTCLIQSLLGIFSYLPLSGPEREKKEEEIQLTGKQLKAITEYLRSFNVLLKAISIGYKFAEPKLLFQKSHLPSKKTAPKVMSSVMLMADDEEEQQEAEIREMAEEVSAASAESESLAMYETLDEEEEETKLLLFESNENLQNLAIMRQFRMMFHNIKYFVSFLGNLNSLITQNWDSRDEFELVEEMTNHMEDLFRHKAVEGTETAEQVVEMEIFEEEEEAAEEEEVERGVEEDEEEAKEAEMEEEEEKGSKTKKLNIEESNIYMTEIQKAHKKYNLGDTSYFCPVTLKELNILHPGSAEITATYRDKIYFFASEEAQQKFLKRPRSYVAGKFPLKTPPLRLLIMGPPGSGKSTISRHLVNKLGICHIQFNKYLQEIIVSRAKKMMNDDLEKAEEEMEDFDMLDKEEIKEKLRAMGKMEWEKRRENFSSSGIDPSLFQTTIMDQMSGSLEKIKEQTPFDVPSLTEKEQAIVAYLGSVGQNPSQTNLPRNILREILTKFWEGETFAETGFILEDFPNNELDLRQMVEFGFYPDAILILETDVAESVNRLLPNLMKKWREKMQKKLIYKEKLMESYKAIKQEAMEQRRKELQKFKSRMSEAIKIKKKTFTSAKGVRFMANEEDSSSETLVMMEKFNLDFEINRVLINEFEDEDAEEEDEEKEVDAEETMKQMVVQMYESSSESLTRLIESLQDIQIPAIMINASKRYSTTMFYLSQSLEPFLKTRNSLFERVVPVPLNMAERMISRGYRVLSRFNRWCPVKLMEGNPTCDFPKGNIYTAIHGFFIYFFSSKEALFKFMQNPLYYLCNAPTKVCIPIRCAIIGPPKSGKSTIANRLRTEYGVRRLSAGVAIRTLIQDFPKSFLVKKILGVLYSGLSITPELTAKAISKIFLDTDCNTNGYALDGCPVTKEHMEALESQYIVPLRIFYLKISDEQAERQAANVSYEPSKLPYPSSMKLFHHRMETYKANEEPILSWYGEERNNLVVVPMEKSKWWVWVKVVGVLSEAIAFVQEYYEGISTNGVASLAGMSITPAELKKRLGHFEEFCPVSLVDRDELVDLSLIKTIEYAAEFKGTYYRLASKAELTMFLKKHMSYVHNFCLPPPKCRPIRRSKEEVQKVMGIKIGLLGFCPVTYFEGDQLYGSLVKGNPEYAVQYLDTIYYFTTDENLLKFMRSPKRYHNMKNPTIIPPDLPPLKYTSLPIPGYLEQSVSQDLIKALTAVGNFKPKYPFLSPKDSAVTYVALYMKAHNLQSSGFVRKRFHSKLKHFEDRCELIKYLNANMTRTYKEEADRPPGFEVKLEEFFRLEKGAVKKVKISFL